MHRSVGLARAFCDDDWCERRFPKHAFAQITPALLKYDGNSDSDQSSSNGPSSDADDFRSGDTSDSSVSSNANDDSESQDTESLEPEAAVDESSDSDITESNTLVDQIMNRVNQDSAAVGQVGIVLSIRQI
jgi:hypothetical protein